MASHRYQAAPTDPNEPTSLDDDGDNKTAQPKCRRCLWRHLVAIFTTLVFSTAIATLILREDKLGFRNLASENCGESPAEARRLGCVFDIIIMGWVPPRCHDSALAAEFVQRRDWAFFGDANFTGPVIPVQQVMEGAWNNLFVNYEFHVIHCTYTWRKMHRAAIGGRVLDGYIADSHHTNHCEMMLLHEPLAENSAYIKYANCPWTSQDDGRFGWYRMKGGHKIYRQA